MIDGPQVIFGGKSGYGIFNRETGEHRIIKEMWDAAEKADDGGGKPGVGKTRQERMRSNDGAVDAEGRYYVGAMNDPAVVGGNVTDEGMYVSRYEVSTIELRHCK